MWLLDFDECSSSQFHDCSEKSYCFNLRGTYTCSCREGFVDLSENPIYPGRICSGELIGCERCNYHGTCYGTDKTDLDASRESIGDAETNSELCECFQWYAGASCQYNLKSKSIVIITIRTFYSTHSYLFQFHQSCASSSFGCVDCTRRHPFWAAFNLHYTHVLETKRTESTTPRCCSGY